jgi:hypothetical protein
VRRSHDADVNLDDILATDALKFAILKDLSPPSLLPPFPGHFR